MEIKSGAGGHKLNEMQTLYRSLDELCKNSEWHDLNYILSASKGLTINQLIATLIFARKVDRINVPNYESALQELRNKSIELGLDPEQVCIGL